MITLSTKAKITKENHMLVIDLKDKVAEGEYDVLVVLDEKKEEQKKVDLPSFNFPVNPYSNYSREEIYSEDGR